MQPSRVASKSRRTRNPIRPLAVFACIALMLGGSVARATPACPTIDLSPTTLPNGTTGDSYSQMVVASGGTSPYTFAVTAGALPPGLSLDPSGLLFDTPTTQGSYSFTITATDQNGCTGERAYTLIVCGTIAVSPGSLPDAQKDVAYSQALSGTGGVAPYAFAITAGALPSGLTLSGAGLLSGTPTVYGTFLFTVTATATGGCTGSTPYSLTVPAVPAAGTDLAVVRVTSGNDGDGTAKMQVTFTPTASTSTVEVYRAPFGGYPRYDDAGGSTPPTPSYPPGPPWVLTGVTASGQTDEPASRDAWSYVVYFKNSVGEASSVSNKTPPLPNYALGDVSNGITAGAGDNLVSDLDISLLGAHYGISGSAITGAGVSDLDVGPTVDLGVTARPFTDNRIDFEDLIVFATNYGEVSAPAAILARANAARRAAKGVERLALRQPAAIEAGETFEVIAELAGAGRVQGLSIELAWDPTLVEPVSVAAGEGLPGQNGVVLSPRAGTADVALLGARTQGFTGTVELARFTFRALATGEPAVRIGHVLARDAANRTLGADAFAYDTRGVAPARTLLFAPTPNPGSGARTIGFSLAERGDAQLAIFSVDGRMVRTLARGRFEPGTYRYTWNGDDDARHAVAPGVYFAQLVTHGRRQARTIIQLR